LSRNFLPPIRPFPPIPYRPNPAPTASPHANPESYVENHSGKGIARLQLLPFVASCLSNQIALSGKRHAVREDLDEQHISVFFRPGRATESDALSDEGEFQSCSLVLVHRRFLNMVDNDDFDWTFPRLQLEPELPLHSLENGGAFGRHALVHVEIKIEIK
jgi:hypothetical protein